MPTYEYECDACGYVFEEFHSMTAKPRRKCPSCKELKVKRLIGTGAGVIFKGSGFYQTDYRSESYKKAAKAESSKGTESTSDSKDSSGTKNKSDTKDAKSSSDSSAKKTKTDTRQESC